MCMDLPVWNPVPLDWQFAVVSVKAFRPRLDTVQDSKNALPPPRVSCLQRFLVSVLYLGVLLRWMLAVYRHTPHSAAEHLATPLCWVWVPAVSTFNKFGKANSPVWVPFFPIVFQQLWSISRWYACSLGYAAKQGHQRIPPDWVAHGVTTSGVRVRLRRLGIARISISRPTHLAHASRTWLRMRA